VKFRIALLPVPLTLLALALIGGSSLILRLFFLSVAIPLISYLWVVINIRNIGLRTEKPPESCQTGEQFVQKIALYNHSILPKFWLKVEDNSDISKQHDITVLNLPRHSHRTWQTSVTSYRRGLYTVGSFTISTTDPFGLFSRSRTLGEPHSVLVYPAIYDLPLFKLSSFNVFGYRSGYQSLSHISSNASSVREFTTGDSLRYVHWPSSVRSDKLMVKVFDIDRSYSGSKTIWVAVDMNTDSHISNDDDETTEDYCATIAASISSKYIENGMKVGMLTSGDREYVFPPERGEDSLWRIMESLALVKPGGEVTVSQMLLQKMDYLTDDSAVVIVTTSASENLVDVVRRIRGRINSIVVVLVDIASFGGKADAINSAHLLSSIGVQVYIVRQGDDISRALAERFSMSAVRPE